MAEGKYQNWKILNNNPKDPVRAILKSRGFKKKDFLDLKFENYLDEKKLTDLPKAKKLIHETILSGGQIGLFCDYDADGICGGTILYKVLTDFGARITEYVPHREEGYGLSRKAVDEFIKEGVKLLITVDCGVKNFKEIKYAKKNKIKSIIVDHHRRGDKYPPADAIIHPAKSKLEFKEFSGGGMAYLLAKAFIKKSGQEKWLLDLAAISTVADMMPLTSDNRAITKFGLIVLNKTRNLGLKKLIEKAALKFGAIGAYEVGYMIAPRLNAAGRISYPHKSFNLLTTDDKDLAADLAEELNIINKERQNMLESACNEAIAEVEKNNLAKGRIIFIKHKTWPQGIIGLVAGRVCQKFYRPTIVFIEQGRDLQGSGRSIKGIDITNLLEKMSTHLTSYGGHESAAGLRIEKSRLAAFEKEILRELEKMPESVFEKTLTVDAQVSGGQINFDLMRELAKLEPYGVSNPKPIFSLARAKIFEMRAVGEKFSHLRLGIEADGKRFKAMVFNCDDHLEIKRGGLYDLAFCLKLDEWNGRKKINLIIEDARLSL